MTGRRGCRHPSSARSTRKVDDITVRGRIELSTLEYDVLWEHLRLGPFPPVLDIESHGATAEERAELVTKAWESLADKELGWPSGLDGRLAFRLRLLARPPLELDARLSEQGQRTSALIAAGLTTAAVAVLDGAQLRLHTVPSDRITHAAVALLPRQLPGTGSSITIPAQTLDTAAAKAGSDPGMFAKALAALGVGRSEVDKIVDVTANVLRFGHFGAARTPPQQRRRRAGYVVSVYDTPHGRYLFTRRHLWATLVPGTESAIVRQLGELLAELTG